MPATLLWLRQDLRLTDHPALMAAIERGGPVVPVYIWAPEEEGAWPPGAASRWWLHHSLNALSKELDARGSRLVLRRGPSLATLLELARECGADAVCWSRRYEPASIARDTLVKSALKEAGLEAESFNSALLYEPWNLKTGQGGPYRVFTPFWRASQALPEPAEPEPAPGKISAPARWPGSESLESLQLLPRIPWDTGMRETWTPGEVGARKRLRAFSEAGLPDYPEGRDMAAEDFTSRLSPYLHFGEVSPRQVWHAVQARAHRDSAAGALKGSEAYLRQLVWREFAHHLLFHYPHTAEKPLRPEFDDFPWEKNPAALRLWQKGQTGYPWVDAGMRQLWVTGWMHNRTRMAVASFLVKDLFIPWQRGAEWFWDTLVDADLANNTLGWQWTAGCGADAAPFFRVFNPTLQGVRFDPEGEYVRRWIPELRGLAGGAAHQPGDSVPDYPRPMVDHARARERALAAFETIRKKS